MSDLKKLAAAFYATPAGNEPVREWLLGLDAESRRNVGRDIAYGRVWLSRWHAARTATEWWSFRGRSNITDGRVARVIFVNHDGWMVPFMAS